MRMLDISPYCWENMVLTMGSTLILNNGDMGTWVFDISGLGINFADYDIAVRFHHVVP